MKNRSTRKNKTRNFRKTNRGGTRGTKSTARTSSFRTFKPSKKTKSSRATNRRGDREEVVAGRLWKDSWNTDLREIINSNLLDSMQLENPNKKGEIYGLIYDIYSHARNILHPKPDIDDLPTYKFNQKTSMIEKIDTFISNYYNGYRGEKIKPEYDFKNPNPIKNKPK